MRGLSLALSILVFTVAPCGSADAQPFPDGLYPIVSASAPGARRIRARRGEGAQEDVYVGTQLSNASPIISSTNNDNQRYGLFVRYPSAPPCEGLVLILEGHQQISEGWGSDSEACTGSMQLSPTLAAAAARHLGVPRQDRRRLGERLRARFAPLANRIRSGAELEVVLTISNPADGPTLVRQWGGRNRGPRNNRFSFVVERDGQVVPAIEAHDFGGRSTMVRMEPGSSGELRAVLSRWADISTPGRYVVRCAYETVLAPAGFDWSDTTRQGEIWDRRFEGVIRFEVR